MNRRKFIRASSLAGTGVLLAQPLSTLLAFNGSPNEKVVVAILGTNSRGGWHADMFPLIPNVEVGFICDPDETVLNKTVASVHKKTGKKPLAFKDVRKLLEQKDL